MLELRNITKTFGEVIANNDVSITIHDGTIHAIVGENGAGKSTIMRIAYGFYAADSGEILVDGNKVDIRGPHDAIALGIGMVHQHFMLVDTMTVAENIVLGAETGSAANLDLEKANREIKALSDELKLEIDPRAMIEDLSVGQQQRVELLKALYRDAKLLILDEPTAVLSPQEVEEFFAILRRMRSQGKTIIIITHKLDEVLAISDEVTVMRDGKVVGQVKTSDTNAKDLARMIVGRDVLLRVEKADATPGETVLSVEELNVRGKHGLAVDGVSFEVKAGEIVGIAGIEGNGQTELIEALAGLERPSSGQIRHLSRPLVLPRGAASFFSRPIGRLVLTIGIYLLIATVLLIIYPSESLARILGGLAVPVLAIGLINYVRSRSAPVETENPIVSARKRREMGIAHIPEDRHKRGLLLNSDLAENSILGVHYRPPVAAAGGIMNSAAISQRVGEIIERFDVRPPNASLPAKSLSGGNQQKLIIGREFELDPKLLLVSQPTRGVDIGAIEFIHRKLIALRDAGSAVLLVSAELEEVTALADRLLVIREGKIVGDVDPKTTSTEDIGLMMTGG